ncbi:MAG: SLBB domain-containing protein [Chloroflexi bacterium]|nr:SLBB domain-containing protein [Chloroflexota bacterium]
MTVILDGLQRQAQGQWASLEEGSAAWIRVGTAICGRAAGASLVVTALRDEMTRRGLKAVVSEVGCLGLCYAEPLVDIKKPGKPRLFYGNVTPASVSELVEAYLVKDDPRPDLALGSLGQDGVAGVPPLAELPTWRPQHRIATRLCGTIDPFDIYQYIANGGYEALSKALTTMTPQQVVEQVAKSGLRGRGGAAFPTSVKWNFLVRAPGPVKYVLVNCEEGDPGAFNDKGILESDPHALLEGTLLAGYSTGATQAYVFIRHGHDGPIRRTQHAIEEARRLGLLGRNILGSGFSFDIEVALTGESYVSGEETALMEAIEGKRAMPRFRPPFPAAVGLWGKPSNINNVKTLAYVPSIIRQGGDWFASIGYERSKGTAILCLSGSVVHPGMYEVPFGMTLRQVVQGIGGGPLGGRSVKLLQTGGPLGGVLDARGLDVTLDFESMAKAGAILGSGGIIVGDESVCAVDMTRNLVAFCQFESCGKCFPCRLGMTQLLEVLDRIAQGHGEASDLALMGVAGRAMASGSLCGHGQLGFNPVQSALRYFEADFQMHIRERRCPTGRCQGPFFKPSRTRPVSPGEWYAQRDYAHR